MYVFVIRLECVEKVMFKRIVLSFVLAVIWTVAIAAQVEPKKANARPQAAAAAAAQKSARPAGISVTANGRSQPNLSASTRNASPIQNNPNRK